MNQDRKNSHLQICLEEAVEYSSQNANGFGSFRFEHDALPEISRNEINLEVTVFGKKLAAPLIIGAMTGGTERAGEINRRLVLAAEKCRVGFALGSQRKLLEANVSSETRASYQVRKQAPHLPLLFGNIGAVQLNYGVGLPEVKKLIETVECDAFNFHLNPLQEAIQPEGNTSFSNLIPKLEKIIPQMGIPVLLKEVGSGFSERTALKIKHLPLAGIETAGLGGTSWSKIESLRTENQIQKSTGELFARWGIPTAESVQTVRKHFPDRFVLASGGIRNGIEIAKAIALGADAAATALPLLKAAEKSVEDVVLEITRLIEELRTTMFLVGAENISALKKIPLKSNTRDYTV